MPRIVKTVSLLVLFPFMFYDGLTSVIGGHAILGIENRADEHILLVALPWFCAAAAMVMNFWTFPIWKETKHTMPFLRIPWILFLLYDAYTSFLGVAGLLSGGQGLFDFRYRSVAEVTANFETEQIVFAVVLACLVVVTPMTCNFIMRYKEGK